MKIVQESVFESFPEDSRHVELEAAKQIKKPDAESIAEFELLNCKKLIQVNALHEVTDPILFSTMGPTPNGLLSHEIFGQPGTRARQASWAYIDLKTKFFHPVVFYNLIRLKRGVKDIIMHDTYGHFVGGDIKSINEETYTKLKKNKANIVGIGFDFIVKNIDKLNLPKKESIQRDNRSGVVRMDDSVRFLKEWIVCPAIYRDVNYNDRGGNSSDHEINRWYANIIRNVDLIAGGSLGTTQAIDMAKAKIQLTLVDIYKTTADKMPKSEGFMQKAVYGKNIDYSGFGVLTAANYMYIDKPGDLKVSFDRSGLPLSHVVADFYPFIARWIESYMSNMLSGAKKIVVFDKTGKKKKVLDIHPLAIDDYSGEAFHKRVSKYAKSHYTRFDPMTIRAIDDDGKTHFVEIGFITTDATLTMNSDTYAEDVKEAYSDKSKVRPMTWTDILYMAAYNEVEAADKHTRITRYPLKDSQNTIVTKVHVLSTSETIPRTIGGVHYPNYPVIDVELNKEEITSRFLQTIQLSEDHLPRLGADHDGDTSTRLSIWSQEANEEARAYMYSKRNMFDMNGKLIYGDETGTLLTFSYLTQVPPELEKIMK